MFKNRQAGITTLIIDDLDEQAINTVLNRCTSKAPQGFFMGMPFVADLQQVEIHDNAILLQLKQLFNHYGLTLIGITNHRCTPSALSDAGLADIQLSQLSEKKVQETTSTAQNSQVEKPSIATIVEPITPLGAQVIYQHVRSGQRIYARHRDLVIVGTVGAGAEIIADGHISVFGSLRGRVFAGAKGNHECFIYCDELAAELISIAGCYQTMEQLEVHKGLRDALVTLDTEARMQIRSLNKLPEH